MGTDFGFTKENGSSYCLGERVDLSKAKKAFRQKAKIFHPDKDPSPGSCEKFAMVNSAYYGLLELAANQRKEEQGIFENLDTRGWTAEEQEKFAEFLREWCEKLQAGIDRVQREQAALKENMIRVEAILNARQQELDQIREGVDQSNQRARMSTEILRRWRQPPVGFLPGLMKSGEA